MIKCICGETIDNRPFANMTAVGESRLSTVTVDGEYSVTLCPTCTIELKNFISRKIKSSMIYK